MRTWAQNGAPEGDPKDKPAPVQFAEGWTIGKPDIIVQFPKEIQLPATGVIDQSNLVVQGALRARHVGEGGRSEAGQRPRRASHEGDHPAAEFDLAGKCSGRGVVRAAARRRRRQGGPEARRRAARLPVQDILAKYNPGVAGQNSRSATRQSSSLPVRTSCSRFTTRRPASRRPTDRWSASCWPTAPPPVRHLTVTGTNNGRIDIAPGDPESRDSWRKPRSPPTRSWCGCSRISITAAATSR